jgi:hypothetical protein
MLSPAPSFNPSIERQRKQDRARRRQQQLHYQLTVGDVEQLIVAAAVTPPIAEPLIQIESAETEEAIIIDRLLTAYNDEYKVSILFELIATWSKYFIGKFVNGMIESGELVLYNDHVSQLLFFFSLLQILQILMEYKIENQHRFLDLSSCYALIGKSF